jgi:hypothetical protein
VGSAHAHHRYIITLRRRAPGILDSCCACRERRPYGRATHRVAERRAVRQAEHAEINVFGDERIDEMFAARAVDDADQCPPAAAAVLLLISVIPLKLQISGNSLFRLDPFR